MKVTVIKMRYFIILKSSTAALKAQNTLAKMKIRAQAGKITAKGRCRFGIYTDDDADKVCRILGLSGISCVEIQKDGGTG